MKRIIEIFKSKIKDIKDVRIKLWFVITLIIVIALEVILFIAFIDYMKEIAIQNFGIDLGILIYDYVINFIAGFIICYVILMLLIPHNYLDFKKDFLRNEKFKEKCVKIREGVINEKD